ncbi:hypothetical protein IQ241_12955 [Romeria aff. gracilis LEGE 07310]|uniref:Uncharacterized protein n=1 Tax=Vasconcelosia minhoensis LEGE 07310 TaxID=915328 RepID=A0A8J7A8V6_9CYAN|nr:hypothetical protein [Romeria gracilis]MBE9078190.1 hypothetical protein [Romeria aff. gracilis LEGE 07310]
MALNRVLLRIVGLGWLGFIAIGLVVSQVFAAPTVALLIDRSDCAPDQWRSLSERYEALYGRYQRDRVKFSQILLISDLGEEVAEVPLTPAEFRRLHTYGQADPERLAQLAQSYPAVELLSCATD